MMTADRRAEPDPEAILAENLALVLQFGDWGLDLPAIWQPSGDVQRDNTDLRELTRWALAYFMYRERKTMQENGYYIPPVGTGADPDTAWSRFEQWMKGESMN